VAGVEIQPQVFVEKIEGAGATLYDIWNPNARRGIEADTVVLALGRSPVEPGELGVRAERIGDCLAPRSIEAVIYEGEERARAL
jgi:hypothetical protein